MSELQTIPLDKLTLSALNARKTIDESTLGDLKASIAANGLLQNLTVTPSKKKGAFDVVAGGRRLRAMQLLVGEGKLHPQGLVPCRVVGIDSATEASLAENTIREPMNPVDEIDAYAKLDRAGKPIADIAVSFGQTERHVRGMLQLSTIAPKLLDELRAGKMTVAQAKAFTVSDDHARQMEVWNALSEWEDDPDDIKAALTEHEVNGDSPIARFVTLEAYQAAGGPVKQDLFGDRVYLADRELLEKLALEKLEVRAEKERKKKWAWVECVINFDHRLRNKYTHIGDGYEEDVKALAGCFVTFGSSGKITVEGPYLDPKVLEAHRKQAQAPKSENGEPLPPTPEAESVALPNKQHEFLLGVRAAILRKALAARSQQRFMLAALAASLACDVFGIRHWRPILTVTATTHPNAGNIHAGSVHGHDAAVEAGIAPNFETDWNGLELLETPREVQQWLLGQPEETTLELLALCAAATVPAFAGRDEDYAEFARAAGINPRDHWSAKADWLNTLPKSYVLQALREGGTTGEAGACAKLKKAELAERSAFDLESSDWLPKELRIDMQADEAEGGAK